jgi:hypothetical protein
MLERGMNYDFTRMMDMYRSDDDERQYDLDNAIIEFIERYGPGSCTWLLNQINGKYRNMKYCLIKRFGDRFLPEDTLTERETLLIELIKDKDLGIRYTAILALGDLDTPVGFSIITEIYGVETSHIMNSPIKAYLRSSKHRRKS